MSLLRPDLSGRSNLKKTRFLASLRNDKLIIFQRSNKHSCRLSYARARTPVIFARAYVWFFVKGYCFLKRRIPKPINKISRSSPIIFGVVPVPMIAWNPDIAPQAMVIMTKGYTGPGTIGPPPWIKGVSAVIWKSGRTMKIPIASIAMVPIFR